MPQEELANLLIKVTSDGFDEAIAALKELEDSVKRISATNAFGKLEDAIKKLTDSVDELAKSTKKSAQATNEATKATEEAAKKQEAQAAQLQKSGEMVRTLGKVYASFWVMVNAPRKFFTTLTQIAAFNRELTTMSVVANMSRTSLVALGSAAATFGGSASGVASLARSAQQAMQSFRMGKGGGQWEEAAALYGVQISGTGENGLATTEELLRNAVVAMERMRSEDDRLGLKATLGIDDATYQLMKKGVAAWDERVTKAKEEATVNKDIAVQTERWNNAVAKLNEQWNYLKGQVLADLVPYVGKLIDMARSIVAFGREFHGVIAAIAVVVTAISTGIAAWTFTKSIIGALKLLKALKGIKKVASSIPPVSTGGSGAPSGTPPTTPTGGAGNPSGNGSPYGGGGGFGRALLKTNALSLGWDIGSSIGTMIYQGAVIGNFNEITTDLAVLISKIDQWESAWIAFTVGANVEGWDGALTKYLQKASIGGSAPIFDETTAKAIVQAGENARKWSAAAAGSGGLPHAESCGATVTVTMNIGTIESAAANYGEFVNDMVTRAKDVVAQRMETADWLDSDNGVIVA